MSLLGIPFARINELCENISYGIIHTQYIFFHIRLFNLLISFKSWRPEK